MSNANNEKYLRPCGAVTTGHSAVLDCDALAWPVTADGQRKMDQLL